MEYREDFVNLSPPPLPMRGGGGRSPLKHLPLKNNRLGEGKTIRSRVGEKILREVGDFMRSGRVKRKRVLCAVLSLCAAVSMLSIPDAGAEEAVPGRNVYESFTPEGSVLLHTELLTGIHSVESAAAAVSRQASSMSAREKEDPACVDQALLFAEAAIAAAVRTKVSGGRILVSRETVSAIEPQSAEAGKQARAALEQGGVPIHRPLPETVVFETPLSAFTIEIHSDILDTEVEKIRIEKTGAPSFAVTFRPEDLKAELRPETAAPIASPVDPAPTASTVSNTPAEGTAPAAAGASADPAASVPAEPYPARVLEIAVRDTGTAFEPGTTVRIPAISLEVPGGQLSSPVTLSLYPGSAEPASLRIDSQQGSASASRYHPAFRTLDTRVDSTDVYTFGRGSVKFSDLTEKNAKLRTAVEALARINVVYGYSDQTFRPDQSVTRAEFVAFVMRALGRVNNSLKSPFLDVTEGNGCYHEIASAYYYGIIKGYDPDHFCGEKLISKTQIYAILGRILQSEMGYWTPEHPEEYLSQEYADQIPAWAQGDVAIATREGLVIRQDTGRFDGDRMMNRGDVALVIYGLYQRIA